MTDLTNLKIAKLTYVFVTLSILQSQFTEKGFKKKNAKTLNRTWCYCCFYSH